MARSIKDIKHEMTDSFMRNATLREAYGISGDNYDWNDWFSKASVENILIYIVAVAIHTLEVLFDLLKSETDERIAANVVATVGWYHAQAMAFQYGDPLVFDPETGKLGYAIEDDTKKVVKYCAVRDMSGMVRMLVSTDDDGLPAPLSEDVLAAFKSYINAVKMAGTYIEVASLDADKLMINAEVQVDPLVLTPDGTRITDGSKPVEDAVMNYLKNIVYGGVFNKTKCVDAIQSVEGVVDVTLGVVSKKTSTELAFTPITGNNYESVSGSFIAESLDKTISYV